MDPRTPAQPRALTPEAGPSGHAGPSHQSTEKLRPARPLEDRAPAIARVLEYGNEVQEKRLKPSDAMLDHMRSIEVWPDDGHNRQCRALYMDLCTTGRTYDCDR